MVMCLLRCIFPLHLIQLISTVPVGQIVQSRAVFDPFPEERGNFSLQSLIFVYSTDGQSWICLYEPAKLIRPRFGRHREGFNYLATPERGFVSNLPSKSNEDGSTVVQFY